MNDQLPLGGVLIIVGEECPDNQYCLKNICNRCFVGLSEVVHHLGIIFCDIYVQFRKKKKKLFSFLLLSFLTCYSFN